MEVHLSKGMPICHACGGYQWFLNRVSHSAQDRSLPNTCRLCSWSCNILILVRNSVIVALNSGVTTCLNSSGELYMLQEKAYHTRSYNLLAQLMYCIRLQPPRDALKAELPCRVRHLVSGSEPVSGRREVE